MEMGAADTPAPHSRRRGTVLGRQPWPPRPQPPGSSTTAENFPAGTMQCLQLEGTWFSNSVWDGHSTSFGSQPNAEPLTVRRWAARAQRSCVEGSGVSVSGRALTESRVTLGKAFKPHFLIEGLDKAGTSHLLKNH